MRGRHLRLDQPHLRPRLRLSVCTRQALRLKTVDVEHIEEELRARIAAVRQKLLYAPVFVDVSALEARAQ